MPTPTPVPPPPLTGKPHTPPKVDLPTKRRRKQSRSQRPRRDNRKSRYDPGYTGDDERNNPAFEAYYRAQRIVPEDEYDALFSTLAIPLPTSFRIAADSPFRNDIDQTLSGEMSELFQKAGKEMVQAKAGETEAKEDKKELIKPPCRLPWYPDGLAWTVSAPRQMLRRDNLLSPFHKFLVRMNDLGAINRQEAVSMVPPLLLDARPGQAVLDMCASPGSKTAQILERVSPRGQSLSDPGLVIANDADIKRCWMLAHQLKRFGSPDLVVTHHEAQYFPKFMAFDRILCDVPCTGDGTMRKAPDIWRRWTSDLGIGIHRLQRMILQRGIELLKPGGRLVYSTCSMNPLENEAVVADALRRFEGDIELLDCTNELPGLVRRPGLTNWLVKNNSGKVGCDEEASKEPQNDATLKETEPDKQGEDRNGNPDAKAKGWFLTYDEVPQRRQKKIVKSLFPPSAAELATGNFPLERCMRLVPHDQDTGAFFVSVLEKKISARVTRKQRREAEQKLTDEKPQGEVIYEDEAENSKQKVDEDINEGKEDSQKEGKQPRKTGRGGSRLITDDPLVSVQRVSPTAYTQLTSFFGLDRELMMHCLLTRGSDEKTFRKVFVVSRTVRTVLRHALGTHDTEVPPEKRVLRVVNAGVRVLERTDRRDCSIPFRMVQEGAHVMRYAMGSRCIEVSSEMIAELLKEKQVNVTDVWKAVAEIGGGSALLSTSETEVVVWVGKRVIQAVVPEEVLNAIRMRVNGQSE